MLELKRSLNPLSAFYPEQHGPTGLSQNPCKEGTNERAVERVSVCRLVESRSKLWLFISCEVQGSEIDLSQFLSKT